MKKIYSFAIALIVIFSLTPPHTFGAGETGVEIASFASDETTTSVKVLLDYTYPTATGTYSKGFKIKFNKDLSLDGSKEEELVIWTGNLTLGDSGTKSATVSDLSAGEIYSYDVLDTNPLVTQIYDYGEFKTLVAGTGTGTDGTITLPDGTAGGGVLNDYTNPDCTEGPGEYCLLAPLPDGEGGLKLKTDASFELGDYIKLMLKVIIGIAGVLAVVMIVIGGIEYMSTDAFSGKEEGKSRITNALLGLVLLVGSFLILNTINPNLVNFNLKIDEINASVREEDMLASGYFNVPTDASGNAVAGSCPAAVTNDDNCPTCRSVSGVAYSGTLSAKSDDYKKLADVFADKIDVFKTKAPSSYITEMYHWSDNLCHNAACHYNGTCMDANVAIKNDATIKLFYDAAIASELWPIYETDSETHKDALIKIGVPSGNIWVDTGGHITGEHFSVYCKDGAGSSTGC